MKTRTSLWIAVSALLCGVGLGYFIHPAATPAAADSAASAAERPARKAAKSTDDAALNRLRKRIQALERQLAEKSAASVEEKVAEAPNPEPSTETAAPAERRGPPSPEEMRARIEEIRRNDPARYAQMTNHFANFRARQLDRAQNKLDILASVDLARLTPKQRAQHERYQDLIARQEELRNLAFAPLEDATVTDAQRQAAHEELRQNHHSLRELAQAERETLLSQTARSFGVKGDAAKELVETVKAVYQATEAWGGGGGGPRRPPPPPDGAR